MDIVWDNGYTFSDVLGDCTEGTVVLFKSFPFEPCLVVKGGDSDVRVFNLSECELYDYNGSAHVQVVEAEFHIKNR